jgi:LysM repeat protein
LYRLRKGQRKDKISEMNYLNSIFNLFFESFKIMNNKLRKIILMALTFAVFMISVSSQITGSKSGLNNLPTDVSNVEKKVALVINDAGRYFKQGLLNLQDNQRSLARSDFDKSVEVFLNSSINIIENQALQSCYSELVETVFLMEFPSSKQPANIRDLATACNWDIRNETIEAVAKILLPATTQTQTIDSALITSVVNNSRQKDSNQIGFSEQTFELSPLDELAKLELTTEEVKTVKTQQKYYPNVRVVKALSGDSVAKISARYGVSSDETAKLNGITINSVLAAGREIRIPQNKLNKAKPSAIKIDKNIENNISGQKPTQLGNGNVPIVMTWFQNNLNDPYSMKIVNWGKVVKVGSGTETNWAVIVRLRAKNLYGAYVLNQYIFFIRQNKIVKYLVS